MPAEPSEAERARAQAQGTILSFHARRAPERVAIRSPAGERSFGELDARANRLARALLGRGLAPGEGVALLCSNRPEFAEVMAATQRCGLRVTPINWHLTGSEVGYIVHDCEARALIADARFEPAACEAAQRAPKASVRLAIGGSIGGFDGYDAAVERESGEALERPALGSSMLYTSGTTGRPKGVYRDKTPPSPLLVPLAKTAAFVPERDLALCTGPLYHAAPLALNLTLPLAAGVGVVLMDKWTPEETLRLVEAHRITHSHLVPTMFVRMLQLPGDVRARHETSSLRWLLHGAAPCPVHVKRAMIEWLGPVLYEYYAATEGTGTFIDSEEWLKRPGSVGREVVPGGVEVRDEDGHALPPGEVGTVYLRAPAEGRFRYFKAPEKTESAYDGDFFTLGDMGYFDPDGYLFLTGRTAELIISGGVNIYPAEIDEVLLRHPAVLDCATVGVPDPEWGEAVRAVVQLRPGHDPSDGLAETLRAFCREHLAGYKCPREIDWTDDLPRLPTGKIVRRKVRERYLPER